MNNTFLNKLLDTNAGWGALALRIPVGIIFVAHGAQKLFGWFGGYGLEGTGQWMDSIGLSPGYLMALLAGGTRIPGRPGADHRATGSPRQCSAGLRHVDCHLQRAFPEWPVHEQQRL